MKRQKELKKYRDELKKGDKVMTTGGIFGKIVEINDFTVIIEVESQALSLIHIFTPFIRV